MKKLISVLLASLIFVFIGYHNINAQSEPYVVNSFESEIVINQDASITIKETIEVNFFESRHGIFRYIPSVYRSNQRIIQSRLTIESVTDETGQKYSYETSREGDNLEIKIGDKDKWVTGKKKYVIEYRAKNIIQRYSDYDELYWNVAGADWDTPISKVTARVKSNFAEIQTTHCFSGFIGLSEAKCENVTNDKESASFTSNISLGKGSDMTIVVGLNQNNQLTFTKSIDDYIYDYWGFVVALLPILIIGFVWFKYGRDLKYLGDNIYYETENKKTEKRAIFGFREYLPMVYSPIQGLTPAEVGTLIDERVDIHDVVAEIAELGRLGFLKIERINIKGLLQNIGLSKDDFLITKLKSDTSKLREYQKYLFDSVFSFADSAEQVKLSELKTKFYTKLNTFKDKLYKSMHEKGYFNARPDYVRGFGMVGAFVLLGICFWLLIIFLENTYNFWPLIILALSSPIILLLAYKMPSRTPKGYALFRQTKGLEYYLGKGKWREEVNEKHLFLIDMLPLAISLGVVKQLSQDMQDLGVKPPSYFNAPATSWATSFASFNSTASSSLISGSSSSGSWSGGSGFSGGSSGGGFGGGGGGSW